MFIFSFVVRFYILRIQVDNKMHILFFIDIFSVF